MVWKLTVISAIRIAAPPATIKIHQLMAVRYAKLWSHWVIAHQATGKAISAEISTSRKKSLA